ncbi:hypothetical protein GCM10011579_049850 [Streptomyces albiflavescens]|uniref:Uncharacterized protein n=1 Tax=Streptomyces albiflavescens TaxID=1623582 RepID=A0A917Y6G5_9ACTN|nr:hypothetical protein [Streptomyces albiflavescens]GGN72534.1 hypothetical protein GCM10011579_049850 [Streptomyces albiflavescens]
MGAASADGDRCGGDYPAGSFVWFPVGGTMTHGATEDGDCTFLFITNKPFDIQYVDH